MTLPVRVQLGCLLALVLAVACSPAASSADPAHPFPQHLTYAAGTIAPNHRTQDQLDADVVAAYLSWKDRYLVRTSRVVHGIRLRRIAFGKPGTANHRRTVSEGQGYGLVILAQMAGSDPRAQQYFNGVWRFTREHPSTIDRRLMSWRTPGSSDSAFDGDADMAYGLLLADRQWGSDGVVDYRAAANRLLTGIEESTIGARSRLPTLGDWVNPGGQRYNQFTPRTSDFMPAHFRAFARFTGKPVWDDVAARASRAVTQLQALHSGTGLLPDFTVPAAGPSDDLAPAPAYFLEGPDDGHYGYNAGRNPWRLGTDALLNGDPDSLTQTRRISRWARGATGGVPRRIRSGYRLNGRPSRGSDYFTTFFAAPLGVAAMTVPGQQEWLNDVYGAVRRRREDYYSDSVTLLCLLVMTRNYWDPTAPLARP